MRYSGSGVSFEFASTTCPACFSSMPTLPDSAPALAEQRRQGKKWNHGCTRMNTDAVVATGPPRVRQGTWLTHCSVRGTGVSLQEGIPFLSAVICCIEFFTAGWGGCHMVGSKESMQSLVTAFALCAALVAPLLWGREAPATEPYRVLSPSGSAPHPAVLLVPGCSGFGAVNGVNLYDERGGELQAAGYVVVFVDYLGRFSNCGHVSHAQVGEDILEAVTWARAQAGVDPGRISVIGWSYGGGGVLAALRAVPSGPPDAREGSDVTTLIVVARRPGRPAGIAALLLLGANDDVARPAVCEPVVEGRAAGHTSRGRRIPMRLHAFDMRGLPECTEYPFGTIGYNAEAANASWATLLDFLK